jgi:hypothetical protein
MNSIAKGLLAGAVGTAALTVSSTIEQTLRGREPSTAPADAAAKVLGIKEFRDDQAKGAFGTAVHWTYGTTWGAMRGLLRSLGLSPVAASVVHFAAVWGSEQVMLPALGVSPPVTEWGAEEVAIDAFHHVVYVSATGAAYEALNSRALPFA